MKILKFIKNKVFHFCEYLKFGSLLGDHYLDFTQFRAWVLFQNYFNDLKVEEDQETPSIFKVYGATTDLLNHYWIYTFCRSDLTEDLVGRCPIWFRVNPFPFKNPHVDEFIRMVPSNFEKLDQNKMKYGDRIFTIYGMKLQEQFWRGTPSQILLANLGLVYTDISPWLLREPEVRFSMELKIFEVPALVSLLQKIPHKYWNS